MVRPIFVLLLGVALLACGDDDMMMPVDGGPPDGSIASCTRDPVRIEQNRRCVEDETCPCGSACVYGRCVAECMADDACAAGERCGEFGRCVPADTAVYGVEPPTLTGGQDFFVESRALSIEPGMGAQTISMRVAEGATGFVVVEADEGVEVSCDGGGFSRECEQTLTAPFTRLAARTTDDFDGVRRIQVQPRSGGPQTVPVVSGGAIPFGSFSGISTGAQYLGTIELVAAGSREGRSGIGQPGSRVLVDLWPGASAQVIRLRDESPIPLIREGAELVGTFRAGDGTIDFPSFRLLQRGTDGTDPTSVELIVQPDVEDVVVSPASVQFTLVLRVLDAAVNPEVRYRIEAPRIANMPRGARPVIPGGVVPEFSATRADRTFEFEIGPIGGSQRRNARFALCGSADIEAGSTSPYGGDVECLGGRYYAPDYAQPDATTPRDEVIGACAQDLAAWADAAGGSSAECADSRRVVSAAVLATLDSPAVAGQRYGARAFEHWLGTGGFFARHVREALRFEPVLDVGSHTLFEREAAEYADLAFEPFWALLTPRLTRGLFALSSEALAEPDYREGAGTGSPLGLATTMARSLTAQAALLDSLIERLHATGSEIDPDYGERLRRLVIARAYAHAVWARTALAPDLDPLLEENWERASREFDAQLRAIVLRLRAIERGDNPLGIRDEEIPLLVDATLSGPADRSFAASDYLLARRDGDFIARSYERAEEAFDDANAAWRSELEREFQNELTAGESARRVDELRRRYGERLGGLCGFTLEEQMAALDGDPLTPADCFLNGEIEGCALDLPSTLAPRDVFYDACLAAVVHRQESQTPFVPSDGSVEDEERVERTQAVFDTLASGLGGDAAHDASLLQAQLAEVTVTMDAGEFVFARPGVPSSRLTETDVAALHVQLPDVEPIEGPSIPPGGTEDFSAASIGDLRAIAGYQTARTICQDVANAAFGESVRANAVAEVLDRDICYRGSVGEAALATRAAATDIDITRARVDELFQAYDIAVQTCLIDEATGEILAAEQMRYEESTKHLRNAMFAMEIIGTLAGGVGGGFADTATSSSLELGGRFSSGGAAALGDVAGVGTAVSAGVGIATSITSLFLGRELERLEGEHEAIVGEVIADAERRQCMNDASHYLVGLKSAQLEITGAMQDLSLALVQYHNRIHEAQQTLASGQDALATEAEIGIARLGGTEWLSEAIDEFESNMRLARRLTYLGVLAAEYSLQTSNPDDARGRTLSARTPTELAAVRAELLAATSARNIVGGAAIGNQVAVVSLRDDLFGFVAPEEDPEEIRLARIERLRSRLRSEDYAVYDGSRYIGQRIPFELVPPLVEAAGLAAGAGTFSSNTCAERLWTVRVGIDGEEGVNGDSGLTGIEIHKDNGFYSQLCADEGEVQLGSAPASRNPLLDPFLQPELSADLNRPSSDSFTRVVLTDVRTNVTRTDLETFDDAAGQAGFAGRGLFGRYAIFFPAEFLRYTDCTGSCTESSGSLDISRVNDVVLRFDYVAAARQR